jgi:hypothetical protein
LIEARAVVGDLEREVLLGGQVNHGARGVRVLRFALEGLETTEVRRGLDLRRAARNGEVLMPI